MLLRASLSQGTSHALSETVLQQMGFTTSHFNMPKTRRKLFYQLLHCNVKAKSTISPSLVDVGDVAALIRIVNLLRSTHIV